MTGYNSFMAALEQEYAQKLHHQIVGFCDSPANQHLRLESYNEAVRVGVKRRNLAVTDLPRNLSQLVFVIYNVRRGRGCFTSWETYYQDVVPTSIEASYRVDPKTET